MEKKRNYGLIIFIIVIIILFIPIIGDYFKKQNIEVLTTNELEEKISLKESFIVYVGELDKTIKKDLREIRDIENTEYGVEYNVYNIRSNSDVKKLLGKNDVSIIIEGDIQKSYSKFDNKVIKKDIDVYYLGNITDKNRSYKVADNFQYYKKLVKSDEVTMTVFGRDNCFYCNKFKPIYNAVAEKYSVDIYFFDSLSYNTSEYEKIINMDLTVPSKCSSEGKEFKLSDGFGTPLTIFTKNNEIVDCISGYVNRTSLIEKLKTNNIISE